MTDEVVEILGVGSGESCAGLFDSIQTPDGVWLHPVLEARTSDLTGEGVVAAIIDTGLSLEHPRLQKAVVDRVDLTGEGKGDECGHGTVVALIALATAPDMQLVDVKALGRNAKCNPRNLIHALDWVGQRDYIKLVNLSAGVYRPWCSGQCDVCQAASRIAEEQQVFVAAGNRSELVACPAKADNVFPIAEIDPVINRLTENSSPAGFEGFVQSVGPYRLETS